MLRDKARQADRKVIDLAEAVVLSRGLLPNLQAQPVTGEELISSEIEGR